LPVPQRQQAKPIIKSVVELPPERRVIIRDKSTFATKTKSNPIPGSSGTADLTTVNIPDSLDVLQDSFPAIVPEKDDRTEMKQLETKKMIIKNGRQ